MMENQWEVRIIIIAILFALGAALLLRSEAISLFPSTTDLATRLRIALGWLLLTGSIFSLLGYSLTKPDVNAPRKTAIASFIALFFYLVIAILVIVGLAGERLLAGFTTIYVGSAMLLLTYYSKDPSLHRIRKYVVYLILVGLGILYIAAYFLHW